MTTITVSEALKLALEDRRDELELPSLEATIQHVLDYPREGDEPLVGDDDTLTEPIKVSDGTRERIESIRDREGFRDYEAVIRNRLGVMERSTGEEPVELRELE